MRRTIVIILIISLISTGCSFFGSGQSKDELTTEANFENIHVKDFVQNRLVFEGTQDGESSIYIYDMNQKTLSRKQGDTDWQEDHNRVHYLAGSGKIVLEPGDSKDRLMLTEADGDEQELVQATVQSSLKFSVAPDDNCFLYWTEEGNATNLHVYDLEREVQEQVAVFSESLAYDDIAWSADGRYVMIKQEKIYNMPDGKKVLDVKASYAVWSPTAAELLLLEKKPDGMKPPQEVDKDYGNQIIKVDVLSGERKRMFPVETETENQPFIWDQPVWDEQGRYFAFVTGRVNGNQAYYEQVHIMDSQGGFHYIENEQNLRPSAVAGMSFSPSSAFFSYTAGGLLKVLYIPTQQSKVFDVYTQMRHQDNRYLIYSGNEAWVLGNYEIKRLSDGLEEKTVYRSIDELLQFFVSANGEDVLVIERGSDHYQLKLVSLLEEEKQESE